MVRACLHHQRYLSDSDIECGVLGNQSTTTCAKCKLFTLRNKPAIAATEFGEFGEIANESHDLQRCVHRGSKRKCCDSLYLCKQFPGESCTPGVSNTPELRSCLTCDLFEPITNEAA